MLCIMGCQFLATFGSPSRLEMIISLVQISANALSILSGIVSIRYADDEKGVDVRLIFNKVNQRKIEQDSREKSTKDTKEPLYQKKDFKGKMKLLKPLSDTSSNNESNVEQFAFADVAAELEMISMQAT